MITLETCKALKWEWETEKYFVRREDGGYEVNHRLLTYTDAVKIACPSLEELLSVTQSRIMCKRDGIDFKDTHYFCIYKTDKDYCACYQLELDGGWSVPYGVNHPAPAEAVALLWIKLRNEGLV